MKNKEHLVRRHDESGDEDTSTVSPKTRHDKQKTRTSSSQNLTTTQVAAAQKQWRSSVKAPRVNFTGSKTFSYQHVLYICDFMQKQFRVLNEVQRVLNPKAMRKNKDKKLSKVDKDTFVEETAPKHPLCDDTDSCRPEMGCSGKDKKKHKKREILFYTQEEENRGSEEFENHKKNGKHQKRKKLRDEQVIHVKDTHNHKTSLATQDGGGSLGHTSPHEEPPRKKKKREKLQQAETDITHEESALESLRKKKKKSREKVTTALEENEANHEEPVVKKKKKKNKKYDYSDWTEPIDEMEFTSPVVQEINTDLDNINATIEQEDDKELLSHIQQTDTELINKRGCYAELLEELKEFLPNVESLKTVDLIKVINYDLPRYKEFKRKGVSIRYGRFTEAENKILRRNVEDFMALTGIDDATKLFFTYRFKEEYKSITKLKRMHKFFERIADGIPRSCRCVYARGRKLFDAFNYMGQFSKEELHTLRKLHTLHGNNWKKISELTGRSEISLQKRFEHLAIKTGFWSKNEVQRLLRAVKDHLVTQVQPGATSYNSVRVSRSMLYKKLPWVKIAAKVKTRCVSKCREKWMSILAAKMSSGATKRNKTSLKIKVKLIKAMYEIQVEDAARINWEDLTAVIGDVPPDFVQRKWHKLKVSHVPNWQSKCLADIIDFLYEKVLPKFKKELKDHVGDDKDGAALKENQQESFLFSDIFQDINDDDDVEDDENDISDNKEV